MLPTLVCDPHLSAFVDPPQRRVALAWRVSFPRPQAIEALRQAIRACALDCVTQLGGPTA